MKPSRSKTLLLLLLLCAATTVLAEPRLRSLNINVTLQSNGDARITEVRQMDVESQGTECYIVVGNLTDSQVSDLTVSDETGEKFFNIGQWDVNASRSWKEGKCGIVTTSNGYELCWGLGKEGSRTYTTSYTVSNLVKAYSDADGFNYMFVASNIRPLAEHVKLTIQAHDTLRLNHNNTGIWAFRYRGTVEFEGDSIVVAETSEPFSSESAMILMCRFEKGTFTPAVEGNGSFEELKSRAFEGSDYTSGNEDIFGGFGPLLYILAMLVVSVLPFLPNYFTKRSLRKKVNKDLLYYRDIPMKGDLHEANKAFNALKYVGNDYNHLLSACILKLINYGAISIDKQMDEKGKVRSNFVIHELPDNVDMPLLYQKLHKIFKEAAGSDTVLEPRELRRYMNSRAKVYEVEDFVNYMQESHPVSYYKYKVEELRELYGLKKYLEDFSLLAERHVQEVTLWKDYMVWATLFGIADQVMKDMKKINPEYFNMDAVANQMADDVTLPMIYATMHRSTNNVANRMAAEARQGGGGGFSSWGGGGGFSGGGSGGGIR